MNPLLIVHLAVIIVGTLLLSSVFLVVRSTSRSDEKAEEIEDTKQELVELKDKVETPAWENPEPFKAEEKIEILDEIARETLEVKKED
jgi:hypothetical protein